MKKGLVLATIFALCSTMIVSAKEFNDARWQWFYSNSDYTGKVDLNTLSYDPSTDTARAWAVWVRTSGTQELYLIESISLIIPLIYLIETYIEVDLIP